MLAFNGKGIPAGELNILIDFYVQIFTIGSFRMKTALVLLPFSESTWEPLESIRSATVLKLTDDKAEDSVQQKEIDKVDGRRVRKGKVEYRVRFKGVKKM